MNDTGRNSLIIGGSMNHSAASRNAVCRRCRRKVSCHAVAQRMLETVQGVRSAPEHDIVRRRVGNLQPVEPALKTGHAGPTTFVHAPKVVYRAPPRAPPPHNPPPP